MCVLEQHIRFDDLLRWKKRHANETGQCYRYRLAISSLSALTSNSSTNQDHEPAVVHPVLIHEDMDWQWWAHLVGLHVF
jgi:hypothetical protein